MPLTRAELEQLSETINRAATRSRRRGSPTKGAPKAFVEDIHELLGEYVEEEQVGGTGFKEFFGEVGRGMIDTQRELDQRSENYLQSTAGRGYLLPSVFRMPYVKGSLKVGLDIEKKTGLNLFFFSSKEKTERYAQHEITFEVAAVPPPPEALTAIGALPGTLSLVLSPNEREAVFKQAQECLLRPDGLQTGAVSKAKVHAETALGKDDLRTLIWAHGQNGAVMVKAYAQPPDALACVGAWYLERNSEGGSVLIPLLRIEKKAAQSAAYDAIAGRVTADSEAQRRFLEGTRDSD